MKKIQVVDLIRSFAILSVMAFHFNIAHVALPPGFNWPYRLWKMFAQNGAFGVQAFFVVSGFLITRIIAESRRGLYQPDLADFYSRRAGRILPLLLLAIMLGLVLWRIPPLDAFAFCLKNPEASFGVPFWASLASFTFNWYRGFFAQPTKDFGLHWDLLWSLSIEEQFYLFYPLVLLWIGRKKSLGRWLWFFIVLGPVARAMGVVFYPDLSYWNFNSLAEFDLISMGCLLYPVSEAVGKQLKKRKTAPWVLCFAGAFILLRTFLTIPTDLDYERRVFGPSFVGAGVFLFLLGGFHLKWFESPVLAPLALPGKLSYGGYLLHPAVLYFLWPLLRTMNEWIAFPVFVLAVVGAAWLSYRFFEMPANQWVRNFLRRRLKG